MSTTLDVAFITSSLFGGRNGKHFNDVEDVGDVSASSITTIDSKHPINKITIRHGAIVDGITIYYNKYDGDSTKSTRKEQAVTHGTQPDTDSTTVKKLPEITFGVNETIISVSGRSGVHKDYGQYSRICQLYFSLYDEVTGATRVVGPFGSASTTGTAFRATANGSLIGFAGYAENDKSDVAGNKKAGLFGLNFVEIAYRQT